MKHWPTAKEQRDAAEFYRYNTAREESTRACCKNLEQTHFPLVVSGGPAGVLPAVQELIQAFSDERRIGRNEASRIIVANLSYAGPEASKLTLPLAQIVGDMISGNPATTCALIIMPNVPDSDAFAHLLSKMLFPRWLREALARVMSQHLRPLQTASALR